MVIKCYKIIYIVGKDNSWGAFDTLYYIYPLVVFDSTPKTIIMYSTRGMAHLKICYASPILPYNQQRPQHGSLPC